MESNCDLKNPNRVLTIPSPSGCNFVCQSCPKGLYYSHCSCQLRPSTGLILGILVSLNHFYTKTWEYRAQVSKRCNSPLTIKCLQILEIFTHNFSWRMWNWKHNQLDPLSTEKLPHWSEQQKQAFHLWLSTSQSLGEHKHWLFKTTLSIYLKYSWYNLLQVTFVIWIKIWLLWLKTKILLSKISLHWLVPIRKSEKF